MGTRPLAAPFHQASVNSADGGGPSLSVGLGVGLCGWRDRSLPSSLSNADLAHR
jgi:hypothetical protein